MTRDHPRHRYTTHGRAQGRSLSWCGRDARHNARVVIATSLDAAAVDCSTCLRVHAARGELTRPLPLPEPRVLPTPNRGAA